MSIPNLTKNGFLPEGLHKTTKEEIKTIFLDTPERKEIWYKFECFVNDLRQKEFYRKYAQQPQCFTINGSFVTAERNPADIDVVLDVSSWSMVDREGIYEFVMNSWKSIKNLKIDFHLDPLDPKNSNPSDESMVMYFQRVKLSTSLSVSKKGLLVVTL